MNGLSAGNIKNRFFTKNLFFYAGRFAGGDEK